MKEVFAMQKNEASQLFSDFVSDNYIDWVNNNEEDAPVMSHTLFQKKIAPILKEKGKEPLFLFVIDNLRFDQWKILKPKLENYFRVEKA